MTLERLFSLLLQHLLSLQRIVLAQSAFHPNCAETFLKPSVLPSLSLFYDISYCMYSDWGYRKRTRIWTNVKSFNPLLCNKQCGNMEMGDKGRWRHKLISDNGSSRRKGTNTLQRYKIPSKLIEELLLC